MIVLTIISYAMPIMRGRPQGNPASAQKVEKTAFWMMCSGMIGMTLAMTVAGVWQIMLQRLPPDAGALGFMATQSQITPVYWVRVGFGVLFAMGLVTYYASFFVGSTAKVSMVTGEKDMIAHCLEANS
jgi:nitric oxide reductase subunit B